MVWTEPEFFFSDWVRLGTLASWLSEFIVLTLDSDSTPTFLGDLDLNNNADWTTWRSDSKKEFFLGPSHSWHLQTLCCSPIFSFFSAVLNNRNLTSSPLLSTVFPLNSGLFGSVQVLNQKLSELLYCFLLNNLLYLTAFILCSFDRCALVYSLQNETKNRCVVVVAVNLKSAPCCFTCVPAEVDSPSFTRLYCV